MANKSNNQNRGKIATAILVCVVSIIVMVFILPNSHLTDALHKERQLTYALTGGNIERKVFLTAIQISTSITNKQGWHTAVNNIDLPMVNKWRLRKFLNNRIDVAISAIQIGSYRVSSLWLWLSLLIPLLIAVIVDGIMTRKIRQNQFTYTSHSVQTASGRMIGVIAMLLIAGLFIPISLPYVAAAPGGLVLAGLIWNWIANLPKRV